MGDHLTEVCRLLADLESFVRDRSGLVEYRSSDGEPIGRVRLTRGRLSEASCVLASLSLADLVAEDLGTSVETAVVALEAQSPADRDVLPRLRASDIFDAERRRSVVRRAISSGLSALGRLSALGAQRTEFVLENPSGLEESCTALECAAEVARMVGASPRPTDPYSRLAATAESAVLVRRDEPGLALLAASGNVAGWTLERLSGFVGGLGRWLPAGRPALAIAERGPGGRAVWTSGASIAALWFSSADDLRRASAILYPTVQAR